MSSSRKDALGIRTGPLWPYPGIVLTQDQIDGRCSCTWVVTRYSKSGDSGQSMKYLDTLCPAGGFHRRLQRAIAGEGQDPAARTPVTTSETREA